MLLNQKEDYTKDDKILDICLVAIMPVVILIEIGIVFWSRKKLQLLRDPEINKTSRSLISIRIF